MGTALAYLFFIGYDRNVCMTTWGKEFWPMHGKATTLHCLPMVKLDLERVGPLWDTV